MSDKANIAIFRGEDYQLTVRPKDPQTTLNGWSGSISITKSVEDRTVIGTGTAVLQPNNRDMLVTLDTSSLAATHSADELDGLNIQTAKAIGCPYGWFLTLTPPGGLDKTYVWGHLYIKERG